MSVRLKVTCAEVSERRVPWQKTSIAGIRLSPVYDGSEENKAFYASTPSGNLTFDTVNPPAAAYFEPGASYYVTIERVENVQAV